MLSRPSGRGMLLFMIVHSDQEKHKNPLRLCDLAVPKQLNRPLRSRREVR